MAIIEHPTPVPAFFTGLVADTKPTVHQGAQSIPQGAVLYTTDTPGYYLWSGNGWVKHPAK